MKKTIEFDGDPMLQLEKFEDLSNIIFYLNENSLKDIFSYSVEVKTNIPDFFINNGVKYNYVLLAEGGKDENENEFSDTYIAIDEMLDGDITARISGIYASDIQYIAPINGNEVILKKNSVEHLKK